MSEEVKKRSKSTLMEMETEWWSGAIVETCLLKIYVSLFGDLNGQLFYTTMVFEKSDGKWHYFGESERGVELIVKVERDLMGFWRMTDHSHGASALWA